MHAAVCMHSQKVFLGKYVNFALNIFLQFFIYADMTLLFSVFTVTANENLSIILPQGVSFSASMDTLAVSAVASIAGRIHTGGITYTG